MKCWKCAADLPDPEFGKLLFRAECDACGAALHCCRNCKYYHPGRPNECDVPGTDFIVDRAKANLCEEFKLRAPDTAPPKQAVSDVESRLFGSSEAPPTNQSPQDKFRALFKDDED